MSKLDQQSPLTYGSEFDVQDHVHAMILDALTIVNHLLKEESTPERHLIARREAGFFTNKPDHSVILHKSSGAPVLCIETKMPFEDNRGPHEKVLGQVFDYVSWLRNLGHSNPFAVLTTYHQTWITWDACDTLSSDIAKELDRSDRKKLASLRKRLSTAKTPSPAKPEEPNSSPASGNQFGKRPKTEHRSLALFGPIEPKSMVTALVNAILCSLQNFTGATLVPTLLPGTILRRQVLTMDNDGYFFQKVNVAVKAWNESSMKSERVFHIISLLGVGRTSKAFRAVSGNGYECVLKVYIRTHDETNNYQRFKTTDFKKAATHYTSNEKKMYKRIYGISVPTITLKGLKCLILPYFEAVPAGKRIGLLQKIKTTLEEKFRKKKGYYRFVDTDIAWRHCGFLNGQLYLFDLADLEECKEVSNDQTFDGYVTHHLKRLRERATTSAS